MTNLEYIHTMSATELAKVMYRKCKYSDDCEGCLVREIAGCVSQGWIADEKDAIDWLNSEYEGETKL